MSNNSDANFDTMVDFKKLFAILQRWIWLLIVVTILCAVTAYLYSRQQTPVYEATTNILVTRNSQQSIGDLSQTLNLTQLVETYVRMLSLDEFLGIVSRRLGYRVEEENVDVTALPNTQVIQLQVQDEDPARAALIADTMVAVLDEQNETLQAGRYAEAEQSLEIQIKESETRISAVQAKLDEAKTGALVQQINEAQANIDNTVNLIKVTTAELERLKRINWIEASFQLADKKQELSQLQTALDRQTAEENALEVKLASDSQVQSDPNSAAQLRAQITEIEKKIEKTRQSIESLQSEIEFFTPLVSEQGFSSTRIEKENFLKTQQSLLISYQNVYTSLLSTEEVKRTTNEIDNLQQNLELYQSIYLNLLSSREDIKRQKMQNIPTIEQISPSQPSRDPVKPRMLLNTLLGALGGLILAVAFVLVRESMDDTVKSRAEVEQLLGAKIVGYITNFKNKGRGNGIYVNKAPRSPVAESFRSLRAHLEVSGRERPVKTILVTSGGAQEGKTTIAANLAAILAHSNKRVILVDADLRRPRVDQYTGVPNTVGLSELLASENSEVSGYIQKLDNLPNLSILPSGALPSNPTELLGLEKMKNLLRALARIYDYVVIDCSPMIVADPEVLLDSADGVLVVIIPGRTSREAAYVVKEQIERTGVRLLGVVFNRLQSRHRGRYSGYSYPYYYSSDYYSLKSPGWWQSKGQRKEREAVISTEKSINGAKEHFNP